MTQDLYLDLLKQPCILCAGEGPGEGWALNQEHNLEGPGGWGGGPENRPMLAGKAEIYARGTGCRAVR
eukprot:1161987-Pelagomonas_calceolata.AAC.4